MNRTFLNDRHADEPMQRFDALSSPLKELHPTLPEALRYPFFTDVLRSENYCRFSGVCSPRRFVGHCFQWNECAAEVLIMREGASEREAKQSEPLALALHERGASVSLPALSSQKSLRLLRPASVVEEAADALRREFALRPAIRNWLSRQVDWAIERADAARRTLAASPVKAKLLVLNTEMHPNSRALAMAAHAESIPVILLQHGFLGQQWLYTPTLSTRLCVWGEVDFAWFRQRGVEQERLVITGSPRAAAVEPLRRRRIKEQFELGAKRAVVFFAPNLTLQYHTAAAALLHAAQKRLSSEYRWYVRAHPSNRLENLGSVYGPIEFLPPDLPLEDCLALADCVLHDHSTMAPVRYAGIPTATLTLDAPYPAYYAALLGDQPALPAPEEVAAWADRSALLGEPKCGATCDMAFGGNDALQRIADTCLSVMEPAG
jgi:hypothetical protein